MLNIAPKRYVKERRYAPPYIVLESMMPVGLRKLMQGRKVWTDSNQP
jgi:hypothetical protein